MTLLTLSNVALKIDPKVPAELLSRATTIPQPDAMNSTEANQTSPIICEVNYVQSGILLQRGSSPVKRKIVAAKPADECKRVPVTIAFID